MQPRAPGCLLSAAADGDVDQLVDLPEGTILFDRVELKSAQEELILIQVDLIRRRNLKTAIKAIAEAESIAHLENLENLEIIM